MKKIFRGIFFLSCFIGYAQTYETSLDLKWEFRQKQTEKWYPASVPGTVHTDLLENKLIPDPYFGNNEKKVQWIENEDWEYKAEFICDKNTFVQNNIELKFEGLDTYAKIYLNEKLIAETNNMFRSWTVNIKKQVKQGRNSLLIVFESAVKKGKAEAGKLPYALPGEEKVFVRKAQYQYGWDWGPRLVTCGIWKPVKLITWNKIKIESIHAITKEIKDSVAKVEFIIETKCETEGYYEIKFRYTSRKNEQNPIQNKLVILKPGISTTTVNMTIRNPQLWWCNGLNKGRSSLYTAGFKISKDDSILEQKGVTFGIRSLELVQEKDSSGRSFYFKLNGVPVFMKGANYIPPDNFLPRKQPFDYRTSLRQVKEANMNMLRVWGGGVYASDEFYEDCDKAGILVWQDLMFACAMYPADKKFIENITEEITEQIKDLRNHPCLALWCGNNEINEGWNNWGWQKQFHYSKKDSTKIWSDYNLLFNNVIANIIKQNDPERYYWPSSPSIGWGHKESLQEGDAHYWGVWWGNEPFETYEKKVGRFMSEYGFQSMPSLSTFNKFCDSSELNLNSISVKNHQKHPTGYETIKSYMEKDFIVPDNFEEFIYTSQLLQAKGMKSAIESHRVAKPYCMGTLFWQLNDCWPVTSWSCIDYYNTPKAFYYSLKDLYADILISVKKENEKYFVYMVNDKMINVEGILNISVKDFNGKILYSEENKTVLSSNTSASYSSIPETVIKKYDSTKIYLRCSFLSNDKLISEKTLYYFTSPKNLDLLKPAIDKHFDKEGNLILKSNVLVKNLYVCGDNDKFNDNYFDLEPGEEKKLITNKTQAAPNNFKFISLNQITR